MSEVDMSESVVDYHAEQTTDSLMSTSLIYGPYQHTTWEYGAGFGGRTEIGGVMVDYHAEQTTDSIMSTSLIYGPYHSRTLEKIALVPEESWEMEGGAVTLKAGATFDDSNRAGGVFSPVAELAREWNSGGLRRIYASYSTTTEMPSYTALRSEERRVRKEGRS